MNSLDRRRWKITVTSENTGPVSQEMDVSALRCTFRITQDGPQSAKICLAEVYNLNKETTSLFLQEGVTITVEAGYRDRAYGTIFTGRLVQLLQTREGGVNLKLSLLARNGFLQDDMNFIRLAMGPEMTPEDMIRGIGRDSDYPIDMGSISPNLSKTKTVRRKSFFGEPMEYVRQIAKKDNAFPYIDDEGKISVAKLDDPLEDGQMIELTPSTGLVGTPILTDNGIIIRMLLEPRLRIRSFVKISNDLIQGSLINPSGNNAGTVIQQFDPEGEYQVYSIAHVGDTHGTGESWITEVCALSRNARGIWIE